MDEFLQQLNRFNTYLILFEFYYIMGFIMVFVVKWFMNKVQQIRSKIGKWLEERKPERYTEKMEIKEI